MTSSSWWIATLLVLAAGVALLGVRGWVLSGREQRHQDALQAALRPRDVAGTPAAPPPPGGSAAGCPDAAGCCGRTGDAHR